jgi:hypothetical protein
MLTLIGEHADFESEYHELCTAGQHHVCALKIYDSAHHLAGTVQIPGSAAEGLQAGKQEFICLSRTHLSGDMTDASEMHPFDDEFDDGIEAEAGWNNGIQILVDDSDIRIPILIDASRDLVEFDIGAFDGARPWCLYNVMLIDTVDGISRRVGLGKVHMDAFLGDEHVWKEVILG